MALRAGYYGIKNTLLKKLEGFSNAVVIKSIGEGLDLSAAGELSNTSSGGVDYSTTEQDTGLKWTDGRTVYQKTINFGSLPNTSTKKVSHGVTDIDVGWVFEGYCKNPTSVNGFTNMMSLCVPSGLNAGWYTAITDTDVEITTGSDRTQYEAVVTIRYVKKASSSKSTKKK